MSDVENATTMAVFGERLKTVVGSVEEIKIALSQLATRAELATLVSRADHSAAMQGLEFRLKTLEDQVQRQSPGRLIDTVTKLCVGISSVAAAASIVIHFAYPVVRP